ncbi:MAG TPA: heavy metal sensor histidine kinase [Blastocatellia bacterium]|nr:heavy metal sensor histidine kinase [Blastocatellia bacterium]
MNTRSIRFRLTVWYAGLLAGLLVLFGASVYIGLSHYLELTLKDSLTKDAQQIGEGLLVNVGVSGEEYVADEIKEHLAPELNGLFVRVTRADGSTLYESGSPKDGSFDPRNVSAASGDSTQVSSRVEHPSGGTELMICAAPFTALDGSRFLIETGAPLKQSESVLHGLLLTFAVGLPLVVAVAVAGGYVLMRRALAPVGEITRSAEQITSRNLSERLPEAKTGDEIEALSIALNRMIARIEHSFRHVNRFSADASHELRTPLTVLRGELEAIVQRPDLPIDVRETIGSTLEESERLSKIVESLLAISRLDAGEALMTRERFDLSELVTDTADQMRLLAEDKQIALKCAAAGSVEVEGDQGRVKQVVVNLVDNAIKYTPEGGKVAISVGVVNGSAVLEVTDSGVGIPSEAIGHVFERFYRVDKARSRQMGGAGLGLSIVKSICTAHEGRVRVESTEGKGSRFTVELPLANGQGKVPQ